MADTGTQKHDAASSNLQPRRAIGRPFPKGKSGNPAGRSKSHIAKLREVWEQESPHILAMMAQLRQLALGGDTHAAIAWLDRILGKAVRDPAALDLEVVHTDARTPEDVRALVLQALAMDAASLAAAAGRRALTQEEHARLVAVAKVTAPSKAAETDDAAGMSDAELVSEARRLLMEVPGHGIRLEQSGDERGPKGPDGAAGGPEPSGDAESSG